MPSARRRLDLVTCLYVVAFSVSAAWLYVRVGFLGDTTVAPFWQLHDVAREHPWSPASPPILGVHSFGDFWDVWVHARTPNPYLAAPLPDSAYPPFAQVVGLPLRLVSLPAGLVVLLAITVGGLLAGTWRLLAWETGRVRRARDAVILVLMAGPVLVLVDRGNVEGLVILAIGGGVLAALADHWRTATVLLAAAIALKWHPAVFLLLFLAAGRRREAVACCGLATAFTVVPLLLLPGSTAESWRHLRVAQDMVDRAQGGKIDGNASLQAILPEGLADHYLALTAIAVLLAALLVGRVALRPWELVGLLTAITLVGAPFTNTYRLALLLLPLLLLIREPGAVRHERAALVLLTFPLLLKALPEIAGHDPTALDRWAIVGVAAICVVEALRRRAAERAAGLGDDLSPRSRYPRAQHPPACSAASRAA